MTDGGQERSSENGIWRWLWPKVTDTESAREAGRGTVWAAGYIAVAYLVIPVSVLILGEPLFGTLPEAPDEALTLLAGMVVTALIAAAIAWRTYRRNTVVWAGLVLLWMIIEVASKAVSPLQGMWLPLLFTLFAVNGLRGALAIRRRAAGVLPTA